MSIRTKMIEHLNGVPDTSAPVFFKEPSSGNCCEVRDFKHAWCNADGTSVTADITPENQIQCSVMVVDEPEAPHEPDPEA